MHAFLLCETGMHDSVGFSRLAQLVHGWAIEYKWTGRSLRLAVSRFLLSFLMPGINIRWMEHLSAERTCEHLICEWMFFCTNLRVDVLYSLN